MNSTDTCAKGLSQNISTASPFVSSPSLLLFPSRLPSPSSFHLPFSCCFFFFPVISFFSLSSSDITKSWLARGAVKRGFWQQVSERQTHIHSEELKRRLLIRPQHFSVPFFSSRVNSRVSAILLPPPPPPPPPACSDSLLNTNIHTPVRRRRHTHWQMFSFFRHFLAVQLHTCLFTCSTIFHKRAPMNDRCVFPCNHILALFLREKHPEHLH